MLRRGLCFLYAVLIFASSVNGVIYHPASCKQRCTGNEFIQRLPIEDGPIDGAHNRAYVWAIIGLIQQRLAFGAKLAAPPGSGRIVGIIGSCLHAGSTVAQKSMAGTSRHAFFGIGNRQKEIIDDALDGAGYWALKRLFGDFQTFGYVAAHYQKVTGKNLNLLAPLLESAVQVSKLEVFDYVNTINLDRISIASAAAVECNRIIDEITSDGFLPIGALRDNQPDPTNYMPTNLPETVAGITQCNVEIRDRDRWQPLCVPDSSAGLHTTNCKQQSFLYPFASRWTPFALEHGDETTGDRLVPPPPPFGTKEFVNNWEELLRLSGSLGDVEKTIVEYWLDGPDKLTPAGHAFRIAADAALAENLSVSETARLLFLVGNALYDSGITSRRTKPTFDYARPISMIQCGAAGQKRLAWRGPYQGVDFMNASEWRPYQADNFLSPPFPGYVSGHSVFSSAAAEMMNLFFGSDLYRGPSCDIAFKGNSLFEPKSNAIPGISDRPNRGPRTTGYSPAEDVVLCWDNFTQTSVDSGFSRLLGGVHVMPDNEEGRAVGKRIARAVYEKAKFSTKYNTY